MAESETREGLCRENFSLPFWDDGLAIFSDTPLVARCCAGARSKTGVEDSGYCTCFCLLID